jgi:glycosyltransferase involved in cell wall biosynthesis
MANKTLAICIPTYNRAGALERTLAGLEREVRGLEGSVEICISDNCSTDATQEVLKRWEKRVPLVHARNEANLGYDRNILAVTRLAAADYIWFMGDDDAVTGGAVKSLATDLQKHGSEAMGAVYVNALLRKKWVTKNAWHGFVALDKDSLPIKPNVSFMGSLCVRRENALEAISKIKIVDGRLFKVPYSDFVLHDFAHSYIFIECLRVSKTVGVAPDYGVVILADGSRVSYKKKLYLELILAKYILEIKLHYPWFKEAELTLDSRARIIGRTFIDGSIAAARPDLEPIFQAYYQVVSKVMEIEGKGFEAGVLGAYAAIRKVPGVRSILVAAFLVMKRVANMPFDDVPDNHAVLVSNIEYALQSTKKLTGR